MRVSKPEQASIEGSTFAPLVTVCAIAPFTHTGDSLPLVHRIIEKEADPCHEYEQIFGSRSCTEAQLNVLGCVNKKEERLKPESEYSRLGLNLSHLGG